MLFSLGVVSCNNSWELGDTANILVEESDFSPYELDCIRQAVHEWNVALNGYMTLQYVTYKGEGNLIVIRGEGVQILESQSPYRVGVTYTLPWEKGGAVELSNNDDNDLNGYYVAMVEHELGHALNLEHKPGHVLMAPNLWSKHQTVTCSDLQQFCEVNGCDWHYFPLCQ